MEIKNNINIKISCICMFDLPNIINIINQIIDIIISKQFKRFCIENNVDTIPFYLENDIIPESA